MEKYIIIIIVLLSLELLNGIILTISTIVYKSILNNNLIHVKTELHSSMQDLKLQYEIMNNNIDNTHKAWTQFIAELQKRGDKIE